MNAGHDENGRPTMVGVLNTDGSTIAPVQIDPTTHFLHVEDSSGGSDAGNNNGCAVIDDNSVSALIAEASDGSIVQLYVDNTGGLLVDSM